MSERDFLNEISRHFGGGVLGPLAALLLLCAALALALVLVLSVMRARRERADADLLAFLAERHRVRPFELEALLSAARAERLAPPLLVLADPASFEKARPRLRAALLARLTHELQVDELLESLRERLFRA